MKLSSLCVLRSSCKSSKLFVDEDVLPGLTEARLYVRRGTTAFLAFLSQQCNKLRVLDTSGGWDFYNEPYAELQSQYRSLISRSMQTLRTVHLNSLDFRTAEELLKCPQLSNLDLLPLTINTGYGNHQAFLDDLRTKVLEMKNLTELQCRADIGKELILHIGKHSSTQTLFSLFSNLVLGVYVF